MATKKPAAKDDGQTEAFVLMDCPLGTAGEVITLSAEEAATGVAAGMLDLHPDAIAAAKANQP